MTNPKMSFSRETEDIVALATQWQSTQEAPTFRPLGVFIHEDDELVGGIYGYSNAHWLYIDTLFVAESQRHHGLGRKLMHSFEQFAYEDGIHRAFLGTYDFQARHFYEKLGYEILGAVSLFGADNYLMVKDLKPSPSAMEFTIEENPADELAEALSEALTTYNSQHLDIVMNQGVINAYNPQGDLVGGLLLAILKEEIIVSGLWTADDDSVDNLAQSLLRHLETIAQENSITHLIIRTDDAVLNRNLEISGYQKQFILPQFPNEKATVGWQKIVRTD